MHGLPVSLAPKQQYEIPFIIWSSVDNVTKNNTLITQNFVFHSVLKFLNVKSPVYNNKFNVFK